jgi:hypothetical protein
MMTDPNDQIDTADDDSEYVSPLFDETVRERYERIRRIEAEMTDEELLARLRKPSPLFADINDEVSVWATRRVAPTPTRRFR